MSNIFEHRIFEKTYISESGKGISFQTGKLAFRSNGSVTIKCGDTVMLVVVTYDEKETKEYDFLPLHVDYQEKYYSVGKIPTNNTKREGKLNDYEVLISRLIDRCIRPIINPNFKKAIDVNVVLLSHDKEVAVESIACFGTSLAMMIAGVPMITCVSECVAVLQDDKWVINASPTENYTARLVVGGDKNSTIMLEGSACGISKDVLIDGINIAMEEIKRQCDFQIDFVKEMLGEEYKFSTNSSTGDNIDEEIKKDILDVFNEDIKSKNTRDKRISDIASKYQEKYDKALPRILKATREEAMQDLIFGKGKRIDGRVCDEIRDISCEVGLLPSAHGSALFTRGETQALVTVTLGDRRDSQIKECATSSGYNDFFLHYNFPNYSVGEVGTKNSVGRREIGHGNLALNGIKQLVKKDDLDNYTIRICSDILCSNGSSSMATVCGSSLAIMDAGVKIEGPVAGIAMGIIFDKDENYKILSDISGDEDELGDMDFKVIATAQGINAIQLDVKKLALTSKILQEGIERAYEGINFILKKMSETISQSREQVRDFAPTYKNIEINRKLIGQIIGIGGNNIQKIQKESNCFIFIEDKRDSAIVRISAPNKASLDKCVEKINFIIESNPIVGNVYDGKVLSISSSGVKVEFLPKKIGLLKINDIDWCEIPNINEVLHKNDRISVKLMQDYGDGKYLLSHKVLIENPNANKAENNTSVDDRTDHDATQQEYRRDNTFSETLKKNENKSGSTQGNKDEELKSMIPDNI